MRIHLDTSSKEGYDLFLKIKSFPSYQFIGREAVFPDEYSHLLGIRKHEELLVPYVPSDFLFDYQAGISTAAIKKRKFCTFVEPGYGKTLIEGEHAKYALQVLPKQKKYLMVAPLMVVEQSMAEYDKFYGNNLPIEQIKAANLGKWTTSEGGCRLGITNFEALKEDVEQGYLGGLGIDESSQMKSAYGKHGTEIIRLGKGLDWKHAGTGTPAPNDRIEYANHAVFMDAFPNVNSFLAKFFVNRGETQNRWELKAHAVEPFYRALSHWSIFMTNPATYGWKDNAGTLPPIEVHVHDVELTKAQQNEVMSITGGLFGNDVGGITSRSTLSQISKGSIKGRKIATNKPQYIRDLVDQWIKEESTIIWVKYNSEQESMERTFPEAVSISGNTKYEDRKRMIANFKAGRAPIMISKGSVLGFGLNLEVATRMVFSGLEDSYETFWQCVKRANRVGSKRKLNVHIPVTSAERPMVENVLQKAKRVQEDTEQQERIFRKYGYQLWESANAA